jgi:hypothetical protein
VKGIGRVTTERERFERAFVAAGYLCGRRGTELVDALPDPSAAAQALVQRLSHPERPRRAQVLAAELGPVVASLETWRYR